MSDEAAARDVARLRAQADLDRRRARDLELQVQRRERSLAREADEARKRARQAEIALRQARSPKQTRVSQADVPTWTLLDVLPIAQAVRDRGGSRAPVPPHVVAEDLGEGLASTPFRTKTAASAAYGITDGGAQADGILLTELGQRVLGGGGDARVAAGEALLRPRLLGSVLSSYNGLAWPSDSTLRRRLLESGYAEQAVDRAVEVIRRNVMEIGLIDGTASASGEHLLGLKLAASSADTAELAVRDRYADSTSTAPPSQDRDASVSTAVLEGRQRVFISTARGSKLLGELAEVLTFGGYWPVAPREEADDATSPEVMAQMRTCTAAVIDLSTDPTRGCAPDDQSLIRVGAALALCGDKVVFLCPSGLAMPRAYEHLRYIHYPGETLDHKSTMALLRAFNNIRGN